MYQIIKIVISIGLFIIGAFGLSAQTDSIVSNIPIEKQGEIVMTKAELISFLEKVAVARKEKVQQDMELTPSQYSIDAYGVNNANAYAPARASIPLSSNIPVQSMSRSDMMREIDALNARLSSMYGYGGGGAGSSTTFVTSPGNAQGGGYYPYQQQSPMVGGLPLVAPNNGELRWKIDSLERQVSMLSAPGINVEGNIKKNEEKLDEISRLNKELSQAQDSLIVASGLTPEAKAIVKQYGTSEMQVLFDNDASDVSPSYHAVVERAAIVLKKNTQLGVVLKGFASPAGNPKYNYDLSMRRNEAVKRMLIEHGVFPDQISSVFYGEDKTSSASDARRVDIKFIIK